MASTKDMRFSRIYSWRFPNGLVLVGVKASGLEGEGQYASRSGRFLTSPRLRGEVEIRDSEFRVRGTHHELDSWNEPLTPTLSPRSAGRGSRPPTPRPW